MIRILLFILLANFPILAFSQVKIGNMLYITDGQNLIRNGDLEEYFYIHPHILFAEYWFEGFASPDYFHAVLNDEHSLRGVPANSFGFQWPRSGQGYLGFGAFFKPNNEVFFTEAVSHLFEYPLLSGRYLLEFYYSCAAPSYSASNIVSLDRLGVSLNNNSEYLANWADIHLFNPVKEFALVQDTANWVKVQLIMESQGGESVISIGNFFHPDSLGIEYIIVNDSTTSNWFTYYYIDDVSMYRIIDSIPVADSITINNVHLYPNPSPNGQFTLEYAVHEHAQPVFGMYDATGRLVGKETLPGGQQRVPLDYSHLASGVYLWRLEQNGAFLGGGKVAVMR